ncbi:unnamed protein product [Enterobius vermicularis]|uniref:G_PROTEIN_RECEP_F1_2 domain-containing protein n=1 Tax=Enterobius vermicularis TaxID=51028 RepID=A0A0N4VCX4_ENTVE|nr:unnamed protein product [Enterobius vermicularis]
MTAELVNTLNGPVTAFFVVVGIILNVETIYILMRPIKSRLKSIHRTPFTIKAGTSVLGSNWVRTRSTYPKPLIYTHLLWLSISDTALLISGFLMYSLPSFFKSSLCPYAKFFPTLYLMSNASLTASVWLMCVLMFERYRALCRPLAASAMSIAKVHKILAAVVVLAIVFSLPRLFEVVVVEYEDGFSDVVQSDLGKNHFYLFYYRIIGGLVFYSVLPYIVLFALSAKISLALRAAAKERQVMSRSLSSRANRIADSELILLAVMAKFLLSRLMPTALDVAEHIVTSEIFVLSPAATLLVAISNLIVVISSAVNFFIYFLLAKSFRRSTCSCFENLCHDCQRTDCGRPTAERSNSPAAIFKYNNSDPSPSTLPLLNNVDDVQKRIGAVPQGV